MAEVLICIFSVISVKSLCEQSGSETLDLERNNAHSQKNSEMLYMYKHCFVIVFEILNSGKLMQSIFHKMLMRDTQFVCTQRPLQLYL